MYNSFLDDKKKRERAHSLMAETSFNDWKQHYSQNRDKMIKKYEKRVQNFIYRSQMQENPIEMKSGDRMEVTLRDQQQRKNIIKSHFRLKDQNDWKSIYTSSERLEMERHRKRYENTLDKVKIELLNRSVASQSQYQAKQVDLFRNRQKDKEIHFNPMRFNYVPKVITRKIAVSKTEKVEDEENESRKNTLSNDSADEDNFSVGSKISKKIVNTNQQPTKRKRRNSKHSRLSRGSKKSSTKNSQKQEKRKQTIVTEPDKKEDPNNMKLHFKAVMDMLVRDKGMSKVAKDILRRCRLVKFKKIEQEQERDLFEMNNKD